MIPDYYRSLSGLSEFARTAENGREFTLCDRCGLCVPLHASTAVADTVHQVCYECLTVIV
jgi:hypothetical protein